MENRIWRDLPNISEDRLKGSKISMNIGKNYDAISQGSCPDCCTSPACRKLRNLGSERANRSNLAISRLCRRFDIRSSVYFEAEGAGGYPSYVEMMPDFSGIELAIAIQQECPQCKIMLFSVMLIRSISCLSHGQRAMTLISWFPGFGIVANVNTDQPSAGSTTDNRAGGSCSLCAITLSSDPSVTLA
jgi:hypothetical protein